MSPKKFYKLKFKNGRYKLKKKKICVFLIFLIITLVLIFYIFFNNNTAKNLKIGNNTTSQEIIESILSINSYETEIEVKVESNKNQNIYVIKQNYNGKDNNKQEVLEPSNIAGVKIIKEGKKLTLENTNLKLSSIFENYEYISDNNLDLCTFIEDYKKNSESNYKENNEEIIMKTSNKELYIDRKTGKPTEMEIVDTNKKIAVYIVYKEVIINS